jgi:hypothetical protein
MFYKSMRLLVVVGLLIVTGRVNADEVKVVTKVTSRLFWQDDQEKTIFWSDVTSIDGERMTAPMRVEGFPKLDDEHQTLVQMESANGYILVGVRDDQNGDLQSGWILINTGIENEDHGDHSHWTYKGEPKVQASLLDQKQGNPAHLYVYNEVFYVANDKSNGFTRLDPKAIHANDTPSEIYKHARFYTGGAGHITLAADDPKVVYATWNNREGVNQGRVDVVDLRCTSNGDRIKSFQVASGGLHGATINSGKVFLAPSDGVVWFRIAQDGMPPKTNDVYHLDLGKQDGKPLRTGSFSCFGSHVAFTAGMGAYAAIYSVDASVDQVDLCKLPMNLSDSTRLSGLEIVPVQDKGPHAFVFQGSQKEPEASRILNVIELDPNQDQSWKDAKVVQSLDVGPAVPEGHGGAHAIGNNGVGRLVYWTRPATGEISSYSLLERRVTGTYKVGGTPTRILAVGQRGNLSN